MKNNIFKQHILFEFLHSDPSKVSLLYEGRSVVPGIETILEIFMSRFDRQIYDTSNDNSVSNYWFKEEEFQNAFFVPVSILMKMSKGNPVINGGLVIGDGYTYNGEDTKLPLKLEFEVSAPVESEFKRLIYYGLGHELAHAYNIWKYMIKNKKSFYFDDFNRSTRYSSFKKNYWDFNNETAVKMMMYRLSRLEMNAYMAQLRNELYLKKDEIVDADSALKAIESTDSYKKNYEFLRRNIAIINCSFIDEETKRNFIEIVNYIAGKNFTTYNQVVKYFNERWFYYQKEYMKKASKIVYDIYSEKNSVIDGCEL